jgi:hypothetical protein
MANVKLVYINSVGGYTQPTATTDVVQNVGKIELTGVSGVAIDAGAAKISNVATPASGTDVATKDYVDNVALGLSWKQPVRAVATTSVTLSGAQTVDSVSLTDGDRVLITGQNSGTPNSANGIYVVNTSGSWSRATDSDASGELNAGTAVFVTEGTTYADTQWVLTTNNPIVVGTTPIIFAQFGGGTSYSAGDGLNLVGTTFSVKGDGTKAINVDASAGVQVKADTNYALSIDSTAGLRVKADTNFGLSIDTTTGLRVDVDANGGVEFNSGDLRVKIASADQLSASSSGLAVTGVPSQFKINGSAVSSNVTHTNLNALTDSSSITALHNHANVMFTSIEAYDSFADGQVAYLRVDNQKLALARADSATTSTVIGVAVGSVGGGFTNGKFLTHGAYTGFTSLTPGAPYYLSDTTYGGLMLYSALTSGSRAIRIGYALSATAIAVNIQDMGVKP